MARTVLIEATPWDNAGNVANVYLAGGGSRGYNHRGRATWKAGIASDPKFTGSIGFDESGWTGATTSQTTKVRWVPADKATLTTVAAAYQWKNAPIVVLAGDDVSAAPAWATLVTGTVNSIRTVNGGIEFTIADLSVKLGDPFLVAKFGGTGGIDGDANAEGRFKRRSFGKVFNVEGFVLDKAHNIYEFGDPANPLNAFVAVRDMGRVAAPAPTVLAWQGSIAATLAALQASTPASGSAVVAPSIACVKWWTQPAGPLTADIQGEVGAGYVNTVMAIAQRLITAAGLGWTAPGANISGGLPGTAEAGIHVADNGESTANVLDRLILGAGIAWVLDPAGSVQLREFTLANPVETLAIVDGVDIQESFRPTVSRRLAYQRSYRTHTDGEISAAVKTADIEGLGALATENVVAFSGPYIKTALGATATDAAYQTAQGTALAIQNQAAAATDPTVVPKLATIASGATADVAPVAIAGAPDPITIVGNSFSRTGADNAHRGGIVGPARKGAQFVEIDIRAAAGYTVIQFAVSAAGYGYADQLLHFAYNPVSGDWGTNTNGAAVSSGTSAGLSGKMRLTYNNSQLIPDINGTEFGSRLSVGRDLVLYPKSSAYQSGVTFTGFRSGAAYDSSILISGSGAKLGDTRNLPNIISQNLGYKVTAAPTYTSAAGSPATATISIAAFSIYNGSTTLSYSAASANVTGTGGTVVTYFLYMDDAANAGGARTLVATTNGNDIYQADGRIGLGQVDVSFPTSGTGSGGGQGGGGGWCVWAEAWVETSTGFVQARDVVAGDMLCVLTENRDGVDWEPCEGNELSVSPSWLITAENGWSVTVSESTPITLRDGRVIRVDEIDGVELPIRVPEGVDWVRCSARPIGWREVAKIRVGQKTYAAGDVAGRSIMTHNPKP